MNGIIAFDTVYSTASEPLDIGIAVVHEFLGAGVAEPSTGLILATTSSFTKPACDLSQREAVRYRLHLRDYLDLTAWIAGYAAKRGR
jgi:hypothetical protein